MTLQQHPLSAAFPAMSTQDFEAYRDGVKPAPADVRSALLSSDWFKSLNKGQRALYGVRWFNWLKVGSNQHVRVPRTDTPRHAAEQAEIAIRRASHD